MIESQFSQTDELTGLFSRQAFLEALTETLASAKAETAELPLSLALIDIDHFLRINEEYGHTAGDNALVELAKTIQASTGENAVTARYGGDEFAVLWPGLVRERALFILEQIRLKMEACQYVTGKGAAVTGISISGGVASFPLDGRSEVELLRKADQALYHAKAAGRGQVRLAFEEKMVPKTTHFTQTQLERLSKLADERGASEADLLREALDGLLTKYGVNPIES
jgi:diguanylate cyclase (GGDEF)-like protein